MGNKSSDKYLDLATKNLMTIIIFAAINIVIYYIFHREDGLTLDSISATFALSTLALLCVWLIKNFGIIVAVIALFGLAFILDKVLKLPFTNEAYNPFFGTIGLIILAISIIRAITNFRIYKHMLNTELFGE